MEEQFTPGDVGKSAAKLALVLAGTLTAIIVVLVVLWQPGTKDSQCELCLTRGQSVGLAVVLALIYLAITVALAGVMAVIVSALRPRWRGGSIAGWCVIVAIVGPPSFVALAYHALGGAAVKPF